MCVLTSIFLFMLVQITCAISFPFTFCPLFYLCMLCLLSPLCTLLFYTLYVVLLFFLLINMSILFSLFCIYRLHMLTHLFTNAGYKFDINSHFKLLCQTLKILSFGFDLFSHGVLNFDNHETPFKILAFSKD